MRASGGGRPLRAVCICAIRHESEARKTRRLKISLTGTCVLTLGDPRLTPNATRVKSHQESFPRIVKTSCVTVSIGCMPSTWRSRPVAL